VQPNSDRHGVVLLSLPNHEPNKQLAGNEKSGQGDGDQRTYKQFQGSTNPENQKEHEESGEYHQRQDHRFPILTRIQIGPRRPHVPSSLVSPFRVMAGRWRLQVLAPEWRWPHRLALFGLPVWGRTDRACRRNSYAWVRLTCPALSPGQHDTLNAAVRRSDLDSHAETLASCLLAQC
jgi:hypothetical protein